jgi:hypothetical protein
VRRAQHSRKGLARQVDVIAESARARHETQVFSAPDGLSDARAGFALPHQHRTCFRMYVRHEIATSLALLAMTVTRSPLPRASSSP